MKMKARHKENSLFTDKLNPHQPKCIWLCPIDVSYAHETKIGWKTVSHKTKRTGKVICLKELASNFIKKIDFMQSHEIWQHKCTWISLRERTWNFDKERNLYSVKTYAVLPFSVLKMSSQTFQAYQSTTIRTGKSRTWYFKLLKLKTVKHLFITLKPVSDFYVRSDGTILFKSIHSNLNII